LEILWTDRDTRDLKKLQPTLEAFPGVLVVTADDDLQYKPWFLSRLLEARNGQPGAAVGHRGWEIRLDQGQMLPYNMWTPAQSSTISKRMFLTSGSGILFDPDLWPLEILCDVELATALCPTASDVWFWIVCKVASLETRCLGVQSFEPVIALGRSPALMKTNVYHGGNDRQIEAAMRYFGLDSRILG